MSGWPRMDSSCSEFGGQLGAYFRDAVSARGELDLAHDNAGAVWDLDQLAGPGQFRELHGRSSHAFVDDDANERGHTSDGRPNNPAFKWHGPAPTLAHPGGVGHKGCKARAARGFSRPTGGHLRRVQGGSELFDHGGERHSYFGSTRVRDQRLAIEWWDQEVAHQFVAELHDRLGNVGSPLAREPCFDGAECASLAVVGPFHLGDAVCVDGVEEGFLGGGPILARVAPNVGEEIHALVVVEAEPLRRSANDDLSHPRQDRPEVRERL